MKKISWFLRFILIAICIKFILNSLLISFIFSVMLGFQREQTNLRTLMLGFVMGVESAVLSVLFGGFPGLGVMLGISRGLGFQVDSSVAFFVVGIISFAYIVLFEMIVVSVVTKVSSMFAQALAEKGVALQW
jgi:hypothetical protein